MITEQVQKKKVLHIIHGFGAGGAETWLLSTVKYLKAHPELNLHFDFLATGGKACIFDEEVKQQGCKIFYIEYSFSGFFKFRKQLIAILKREKYDALHDHQDFISGWHFFLALGALPVVRVSHLHNSYNFVHNYIVNPIRWISFKFGRLLTVALTTKITATSDAVMDVYGYDKWPYRSKRVSPTYCGFEVSKFSFNETAKSQLCKELVWNETDKIAIFVGRIGLEEYYTAANEKNPEFAFLIAKKLVCENKDWRFVFVGYKGKQGEEMEAELKKIGLQDKIKFLGIRNDVPAIMSASDVLVFPSLWEGLGMVAVEAQACGLPVIMSSNVPKEAIINKELITIKELTNSTNEWVEAIQAVAAKKQIKRESCAGKIEASFFSIHRSINNMLQLYSLNRG